jgi:hypothetical protein
MPRFEGAPIEQPGDFSQSYTMEASYGECKGARRRLISTIDRADRACAIWDRARAINTDSVFLNHGIRD